jgi:hypothetical protein
MKKKAKISSIDINRFENGWKVYIHKGPEGWRGDYSTDRYFFNEYNSVLDLLRNINSDDI